MPSSTVCPSPIWAGLTGFFYISGDIGDIARTAKGTGSDLKRGELTYDLIRHSKVLRGVSSKIYHQILTLDNLIDAGISKMSDFRTHLNSISVPIRAKRPRAPTPDQSSAKGTEGKKPRPSPPRSPTGELERKELVNTSMPPPREPAQVKVGNADSGQGKDPVVDLTGPDSNALPNMTGLTDNSAANISKTLRSCSHKDLS